METLDAIARETAQKISDWESKTYGKPNYAHPSQQSEVEHLTPIILAAIKEGIKINNRESLNP